MNNPFMTLLEELTADWRMDAACAQMPLDEADEVFFPLVKDESGKFTQAARAARDLCSVCPVSQECLEAAMREEEGLSPNNRSGMRGGLSGRQRYQLARGVAA